MKTAKKICLLILVIHSSIASAEFSLDLRSEYETWNNGINGKTSAVLFGLNGTRKIDHQWSFTAGFIKGSYDGNNERQDDLKRSDIDFAVGYRYKPNITLFAGYRLLFIDYKNSLDIDRSFDEVTNGLGTGVSVQQAVYHKTYLYGRLGLSSLYSVLNSETTGKDRGTGWSTGLETGLIYQVRKQTTIGLSIKQQYTVIDYRGGLPKWKHNYIRIGISVSQYISN